MGAETADQTSEERVLVLAPVGRDGALAAEVLAEAGLETLACADADAFLSALAGGAGAAVLAQEALTRGFHPAAGRLAGPAAALVGLSAGAVHRPQGLGDREPADPGGLPGAGQLHRARAPGAPVDAGERRAIGPARPAPAVPQPGRAARARTGGAPARSVPGHAGPRAAQPAGRHAERQGAGRSGRRRRARRCSARWR